MREQFRRRAIIAATPNVSLIANLREIKSP
jgi:hypothetical protein